VFPLRTVCTRPKGDGGGLETWGTLAGGDGGTPPRGQGLVTLRPQFDDVVRPPGCRKHGGSGVVGVGIR